MQIKGLHKNIYRLQICSYTRIITAIPAEDFYHHRKALPLLL